MSQHESLEDFEIRMQLDAVCRTLHLQPAASVHESVAKLARAEAEAQFFCGFAMLAAHAPSIDRLEKALADRGLATAAGGRLTLTEQGRQRATTPLPPEIEAVLRGGAPPRVVAPPPTRRW